VRSGAMYTDCAFANYPINVIEGVILNSNGSCNPYMFSPVWSFTTASTVAVQQSTWGAIKALYR
jgi:hypothetical protein